MGLATISTLVAVLSWVLWRVFRHTVVKSPIRNIPGPPAESWYSGNLPELYNPENIQFHHDMIERYGRAAKINGIMGDEHIYVTDSLALHHIIVKEQDIYEEPSMQIALNLITFGEGLLSTIRDQHRRQRKILNPVFSIKHMRNITPMFYDVSYKLCDILTSKLQDGPKDLDMLDWLSRTALEFIAVGGMGYSFGSLDDSKRANSYSKHIKDIIPAATDLQVEMQFLPLLKKLGPPAFRRFLVDVIPYKSLQRMKFIVDIMHQTSVDILDKKKAALAEGDEAVLRQIGQGKDIISVLLRANMDASEKERLSDIEVIAQMTTIIFAAHDTTSSALCRVMHTLCVHPDVQEKLRQEVIEARRKNNGADLSYDDLVALPYLDAVCRETLRFHAPVTFMSRTARRPLILPLMHPMTGTDGKIIREIPIAYNQNVIVGMGAVNRDKAIWGPDADVYRPERWLEPLPSTVAEAHLPGVFAGTMTFSGGSRACIGFKFSQLELKVVLCMLLERYSFSLPEEEIVWRMLNISMPTVKGKEKETPQMPLKLTLL